MNTNACNDAVASDSGSKLFGLAYEGISLLAEHEGHALGGHWLGLKTRWAVARKARNVGELLRDQYDLLPDTRARFAHDHQVRRALVRGLERDLRRVGQRA